MEKIVSLIYLIGVAILILPAFISTNSNFKNFFTNLSIWIAIILVIFSIYYVYKLLVPILY